MTIAASPANLRTSILRELEWFAENGTECPRCGWPKDGEHHHPTCPLALALREPETPEPLFPVEVSTLAAPLEHVLEQLQHAGPSGGCPLCTPNGFGNHHDLCPLGALIAALPGRQGGVFLSTRRRARDLPAAWPRPLINGDSVMVGLQASLLPRISANDTVSLDLTRVVFHTMNGVEVEHRVSDLALTGDNLILLLGARTRQVGYVTEDERREARRAATKGKHGDE